MRALRMTLRLAAAGLGLALSAGGTARAQQPPIYAFTSQLANNAVQAVNVVTGGNVDLDDSACPFLAPRLVVASPDGKYVFVSNSAQSQYVCPIRVSDRTVLPGLWLGGGFAPYAMQVTPDSRYLFIASLFRLIVFDLQGPTPPTTWVRNEPLNVIQNEFNLDNFGVAVSPKMEKFYVATRHFNFITGLQTSRVLAFRNPGSDYRTEGPAATLEATVPAPFAMSSAVLMTFRRDGTRAFIARDGGSTGWVIDAANNTILSPGVNFPASISDLQIRPDGNFIYAAKGSAAQLFELDSQTLQHARTIDMFLPALGETQGSFQAFGVSFRADSSEAVVALNAANSRVRTLRFSDGDIGTPGVLNAMGAIKIAVAEPIIPGDTAPPQFSDPKVTLNDNGNFFDPETTVFSHGGTFARLSVQDPSGLANGTLKVELSATGGDPFVQKPAIIFDEGAGNGLLTIQAALSLVQSWSPTDRRNVARFSIADTVGNLTPPFDVPIAVNMNPSRTPSLASPAEGAAIAAAQATLTWAPHADIPIQAIRSSKIEISADSFSSILQTLDVTAPALTATVLLPPGKYHWRVRMLDKFGEASYSLPSPARSFTLDLAPPELSQGEVAAGGSGLYEDPLSEGVSFPVLQVDARACAQDSLSGLANATARGEYSSDGGVTFSQMAPANITVSQTAACPGLEAIHVNGLPVVHSISPSQTLNVVRLSISDKAGNPAVPVTMPVTANLNPIRAPTLVSPVDDQKLTTTLVQLQWGLDSIVPMGAIASFTVEVARTDDFLTGLQRQTVNAPDTSATFSASPGRSYWRVRALDNFGQQSLYSAVRSFDIDTTPPVMSSLESAVSGSGDFQPVSGPITYAPADVRVKVQDAESGLHAASRQVAWSGDGQLFTALLDSAISGPDGSQGEETITVSGLNLPHSLSASDARNHLRFRISNKNGMETERTIPVFVNRNTSTPPIAVAPALPGASLTGETVTFEWTLDTLVPPAAIQTFELQISPDPNFVNDVIERTVNAPTVVHVEALASGSYYWRVRAIDKITPAIPSPYSKPSFFTFKYVKLPSVRIDAPLNGATENDPRGKLQATYERNSADLDLTTLRLELDGTLLSPVVDVDYSPAGDNGPVSFEQQLGPLASKHQMVASGGHLFLIAGNQSGIHDPDTPDSYSSRVFRSQVQANGTLGAWQQTTFGLPMGLKRVGAASNNGFLYVAGGLRSLGLEKSETRSSVYFAHPSSSGDIDSPWTSGPDLLVPAQGIAVAVANRDEDFLYAIGGNGVSDGYSDPMPYVQVARIRTDGSLEPWKLTTPLPIPLSGASAFEWHGRVYVTGGQTRIPGTTNYPFFPSQKMFYAVVDRSGNLGPWTESPETLPVVNALNPLQEYPYNSPSLSAPIVHKNGQLLFFNGLDVNWTNIATDGTLLPWRTSANRFPIGLQFAAAAVSGDYAYIGGGWNGSFDQKAVRRTAFNAGSAQRAIATFNPTSNLPIGMHTLNASINDIDGFGGSTAGTFNTANVSPTTVFSGDTFGTFTSYEPMTMTPRDPGSLPTPVGVALQAGLVIPPGLKIYEMAPHTLFDSPATITLGWLDADGNGIVDGTTIPESSLLIYKFNGQAWVPVSIVERNTGANFIRGELFSASHFALMALERDPPVIASLTPVHGSTLPAGTSTSIAASFSDNTGVLASGVRLYLDGTDVTSQAQIGPDNTAAFVTGTALADGVHSAAITVADFVGNYAHRGSTFSVDGTAPVTALAVAGGRQASGPDPGSVYASSDSRIVLTATDPLVNGASAGLSLTRFQINGSAFANYSAPFSLSEGSNVVAFGSVDGVANAEVLRSSTVLVDASAPISSHTIGLPSYMAAGGAVYVASHTLITFSAQDPALPDGASGSGVDFVEVSIDEGPFAVQAIPLSFAGGSHTVRYRSVDRVGVTESAKMFTAIVDAEAPTTAFSIGTSSFVDSEGTKYVTPATPVTFSAQDPLSGGAAGSGVARIEVALDGAGFTPHTGPMTFTEGRHTLLFRAVDLLGNVETTQTLNLRSDASAALTSLAFQGGRQASGPDSSTFYASTATRFLLPALDPVVSDVASGLASTNWRQNGGPFQAYSSTIAFAAGVYTLDYQSQDRAGNLEVLRSTTVRVDGGGPFTIGVYGSPNAIISGVRYVTPATMLWFNSVDTQILPGPVDGSGVDRVMVQINGAPFTASVSSLTFAEGRHTVRFRGIDRVENAENLKTVSPWSDGTPPRTTLALQGGLQAPGPSPDSFYASSGTRIALSAVDPLVANVSVGLDFIRWQDNGGAFQNYSAPVALTEGVHVFGYQSQDRITNLEVLRSSTALVDAAAPVSSVTVGAPAFVDASGARYVTPATPVTFSASDPALPGGAAGSGVDRIEVSVDGSAYSTYTAPLTFAQGLHTVSFRSKDRVGNVEPPQTLTLRSDAAAPLTALAVQGGRQASGPDAASFYASSDTRLALSGTDPLVSGIASGVDYTRWQENGGAFQAYAAPLGFAEGVHLVAYQSQDRVGNLEVLRSTTVLVDATAPTASLSVGLPRADWNGTRYVSSSTLLSLSAEDPDPAGSASGLGLVEKSVDGAPFTAFTAPFALPEGSHNLSARAADRVGNVSLVLSSAVVVDAKAPAFTALEPGAGARFLPSGARLEVRAQASDDHDPAPAISAALVQLEDRGSPRGDRPGVVPVQDGSSFAALDLDDGLWELRATAVDFVANGVSQVAGPFEVVHDLLAPRSSLAPGTPAALVSGSTVVARATPLFLTSVDDLLVLGDASGLGVRAQYLSVDGVFRSTLAAPASTGLLVSTFTLGTEADGWHQITFYSDDVLGNAEPAGVVTVGVDETAPVTSLALIGGVRADGADAQTFYASSATRFTLPAADPVINGVASGVGLTQRQVNGGPWSTYAGPFALAEGSNALAYRSQDRLGKLEVVRSTVVLVDAAAPQSTFAIGSPSLIDADGTRYVTPASPVSFTATDPALPGGIQGSGIARVEVAVDGGAFTTYSSSLTFSEGRHTVQFRAIDRVGNVESAQTLSLRSDASAPQTALAAQGGRQAPGGTGIYASSDTRFALAANDPIVADVAVGVAFTRWQDNGGALQAYSAPFSLSEGSHLLGFQSQDRIANLETLRSFTVYIDATAPVSAISIGEPLFIGPGAVRFITPATPVSFSAQDPALPGGTAGSGLDRIEVAVDGGAFAAYSAPLTFVEGRHSVQFRAVDRVGNVEAAQTLALRSDASAPETSLAVQGGKQIPGTSAASFYASSDTRFALPSADPIVADVASGVDFTTYRDNGAAIQAYSTSFGLPEGTHLLTYQSRDKVANQEATRSTTVFVDAAAPLTAFAIGAPSVMDSDGTRYITPATPVGLTAADPALPGGTAGSGVDRIEVSLDGGAYTAYTSVLTFSEGRHTVRFRAADRVGNVEAAQTLSLRSDASAPLSSLTPQGGRQAPGPDSASFYASSDTVFALPAADPVVADVAAGVDFTRWQDNGGPVQTYSAPLILAEGSHRLDFQSQDRVANLEALRSSTVHVDATPPVSSYSIGDPLYTGVGAVKYITPATPVTFSVEDAALPDGTPGSGTDRIEVAIDGGAFVAYSAALTFAEGRHTVLFRAVDRVRNVEVAQSLALRSDASAPETSLALRGGKQAVGANPGTFYASFDTRFALPAADPLVADVASGVDFTIYRDNGGAIQPYSGPFALSAGSHILTYQSRDVVRNQEVSRSTTVMVDGGAPVSSYSIGEPLYNAPGGVKFITPATPVTFSAADPALPGGVAGSGVDKIEVSVDGSPYAAYSGALTFAEGRHTVEFRATDRVGNVEPAQTLALRSDATPPQTSLAATGGSQAPGLSAGTFYASSDTSFVLSAIDPNVADVASGVDFTTYRDNGGAIQPYSGPFGLPAGSHLVSYQSRDVVFNLEAVRSTTVLVDAEAPVTAFSLGEPLYTAPGGIKYVTPATPLTFSAADPALPGGATGSGVDRIEVSVDGAPFAAYAVALTFSEGRHTVLFRAVDRIGNTEMTQSLSLRSDNSAAQTALTVQGGRQAPGPTAGSFYTSGDTLLALPATDPTVADVASGLDFTRWQDGGGSFQTYSAPISLAEGSHLLSYQSQDRVGNLEALKSTTAIVDASAPNSAFAIGAPSYTDEDGMLYLTPTTQVSFSAQDPGLPGGTAGSGVERIEVAVDGGAFAAYTAALIFAEGRHTVQFRAMDRVGNVEAAQSLALRSDATAPLTSLAPQGGRQAPGPDNATFYTSSDTRFVLSSFDPVTADVASGLEFTRWQDAGGSFQTYSAPIALSEGSHLLAYQSQDRVTNLEVLRSTTVLVDAMAPQTTFAIGSPSFVDAAGVRYVTPATQVTFAAQDPALPGGTAGSGVDVIEVSVDGGAYGPYSTALTFVEGRHTVRFRTFDRVGNVEEAQTISLRSDQFAPQTSLTVQGGTQAPGPDASSVYASSPTRVVLTATDPTVADVASGVDFIRWQDNGGPLSTYEAPLTLSEGAHILAYQSRDRVENLEVLRSTTILLDATAPQSAFAVGTPSFIGLDGTRYISPATPVSFSAQDPALPGGTAGSGVERIEVAVDGGAFAAYTAPLTFPEGRHTVQYRVIDRVGNAEAAQTLALRSDGSAAQTSLAILGGRQAAGPTAESFYASSDTRLALPAADPIIADVASGVDFTRWQDSGGATQTYSAPISLAEGSHLLGYQSQDHVGNLEVAKTTAVLVDASAPNSAFAIGAPSFTDADGTRYVTPASPVSFSAQDPALPGGTAGSGVDRIEVAVDGGAFAGYSTPLTFAEGRHTLLFRAVDRVGNAEETRSLALRSDASTPQTSMAAVAGRQAPGPDAATLYASGDSLFAFPASDPVAGDVASGIDFTRWRDGTGAFQTYSAPVSLVEGAHPLAYQSQDRVSNLEILRSTTVLVDSSAPQSAFVIGAPAFVPPDGTRYITPATPVSFSASDPALPGGAAGSGVDRIEVAIDGGAFAPYSAALTFAEGRHTVQFRAVDRVGNSETPQTLALRSDATPPQTAFTPSAAFYSDAGRDYAPAQFTYTLPAADPLVSDVASGVAETTFAIDAAPRHPYTGAFSLSEGIRAVTFGSRDNVLNLEEERSATVYVDATAPRTSLAVSGGRQAPGPDASTFYASLDTRLNLPALDPSVSGVASGLDATRWQDNSGAFQSFSAPIALAAGAHLLSYRSHDHVGNLEIPHSTTVLVDAAAPVTAFQIGSPAFVAADGTRYVTPQTPVTFTASDPALAGGTAGSGVDRIEVSVDGAPYSAYSAALTLTEGRHVLSFRSLDRVGNVEAAQTLALRSDASGPQTSLAAQGGRQIAGPDANTFYASLDTRFGLPAADPVVLDVAAGVDFTRWRDNGGAFETYSAPLTLAEGSHLLAYQSQDKVQNLEVLRSTTVLIDATAPLTVFSIGGPSYTDVAGVHYITPATPLTFAAQDPDLPGGAAGSGVERIEVALDAAGFQTYAAPLTFAEGRHSIRFRTYDRVGNVESEKTLEVRSDASAPMSSLAVQGGRQTAGPDAATRYVSADARIALSASDPVVADVASGLDLIRWRDNGGAFQTYAAPTALAEGSHLLSYQGQDKVQNLEALRSTTVLVDATAPHTAFQIGTPAFTDLSGTRYITPTTPVTFTAEDPALPGGTAGAGVERIEVAVDGGAFTMYSAALTFPEGRHTVQFRATDRVGNVEAAQALALRSDASAPLTAIDIQGGRQAPGPNPTTFYASSATRYALLATDPVVADVASGVEFTRWQDNGGSLMAYTSPIAFPEGVHILTYASEDRVRNVEAQKGATALVDATPPVTAFSLNGPRYAHAAGDQSVGGELFVSPVTGLQLSPTDPVSNGVASGMDRLLASLDGGAFLPWPGGMPISQEGTHTLAYRGADRVGNEEGTRTLSLSVDATPPSTLLTFDGPALIRGPGTTWEPQQAEAFITPVTKIILTANDRVSAGIASGVKLTLYRIDSGPWQVYAGYFYLSNQGLYLVEFAAEDRVGNLEALVAMRIAVDNTAPLASAAVNGSWLEAFGLNLLSTAATVSLTANDSPVAGVGVGLARILYRIDSGGLIEYTSPFTLGVGSHTVAYQGVDLLGNVGSPQTLAVRVLRFLGGSLAATGAIDGSGTADVGGLLQTNGGLNLTGNLVAAGGADAFSISLKGGAILTGPVTQGVRPLLSDWIDLNAIQTTLATANDNAALPLGSVSGGVLRLNSGQTVTLATGTYLLSGIDISGGAKLLTAGPVRIFVSGSVKLGGNSSLNEAGPARNLVIFGSGPAADLNSAGASAIIYLPSAALGLSGEMRLGGSALAASVTLAGNSNAAAPGLEASAPTATAGGAGKGGKLALASLSGGVGLAAGADSTFVLHEIYAFPNPAVGGARPTVHVAVGVADRVTIRIYDIAGQQVHQTTLDSPPAVIDDGSGPKFAYEMPWGGHIPSGVYLYTVIAEKSGQGAIRKAGKFAVVR